MVIEFPISAADRDARQRESACTIRRWKRENFPLPESAVILPFTHKQTN